MSEKTLGKCARCGVHHCKVVVAPSFVSVRSFVYRCIVKCDRELL